MAKKPDTSHSVRVPHELWDWFNENFTWDGAFPFFVVAVLKELRDSHGERMPPTEAAAKVAKRLKRRF